MNESSIPNDIPPPQPVLLDWTEEEEEAWQEIEIKQKS